MFTRAVQAFLRLSVLWLCCAALCGCSRRPPVAQVKGKVLYKDGSVPSGAVRVIRFQPASGTRAEIRKAASGEIDAEDGSFEMYTRRPGDGVYLGDYDVTFSVLKNPRDKRSSLIADTYTSSATTPYHITIERDVDDLLFEIEPLE